MKPGKRDPSPDVERERRKKPSPADKEPQAEDPVDEAGEESFPASDPPSYNPQKTGN